MQPSTEPHMAMPWPRKCHQPFTSSLLFDLEVCDEQEEDSLVPASLNDLAGQLQDLTRSRNSFEQELAADVRAFKTLVVAEEGRADVVVLAAKLASVGYQCFIRTALGGGTGQEAFHNLNHEFLLVAGEGLHGSEYLIDPNFREQFMITAKDEAYELLLSLVPPEFVGPKERLIPLVQLLACEMAAAFKAAAVTCPPWRSYRSLLSKWVPAKVRDMELPKQTPRGGSPTSTLTPPGNSPPPPLRTLLREAAKPVATVHVRNGLRAHSADLPAAARSQLPRQLSERPCGHSLLSSELRGPTRTASPCAAPAKCQQGFRIEAAQLSPQPHAPALGMIWRREPQHPQLDRLSSGALDIAPRARQPAWQQPICKVKMRGSMGQQQAGR